MYAYGRPEPIAFTPAEDGFRARLGESPVWSARDGVIWWVDIDGGLVCRTDPASSETQHWPTPERPGFVVLTEPEGLAVGMETGIFRFDPASGQFTRILAVDQPGHRFNDATVDAAGRLWAGSMALDAAQPTGVLYCVGPDLQPRPMLDGFRTVNGLAVDSERGRLYVSDTNRATQTAWTLPLDGVTGSLGERRLFHDFSDLKGRPDGAALDRDGRYWIAGVSGGELYCFAPDATLLETHPTPAEAPTKPAFFGAGLDRLCLTSKGGPEPAGAMAFSGPMAVPGRPIAPWRIGGI